MVEKKVVKPLKPKLSKIIFTPKDKIISPPKFKTKQINISKSVRTRKHKAELFGRAKREGWEVYGDQIIENA